jgi:hypothetical protein
MRNLAFHEIARNPYESAAPELWPAHAWIPALGIQGGVLFDVAGGRSGSHLATWRVSKFSGLTFPVGSGLSAGSPSSLYVQPYTMMGWLSVNANPYVPAGEGGTHAIIDRGTRSSIVFGYWEGHGVAGDLQLGYYDGAFRALKTTAYPVNSAFAVTAVKSAAGHGLYLCGDLVASDDRTANEIYVTTRAVGIGERKWTTGHQLGSGAILYSVMFWGRALSASQIQTLSTDPLLPFRRREITPYFFVPASGGTDLVVDNSYHVHTSDNVVLSQSYNLAAQNAYNEHVAGNIDLQLGLSVDSAFHTHQADSVNIVQDYALSVNDSYLAVISDEVLPEQTHILSVAGSFHSHTSEGVVLEVAGDLAVDDAYHEHSSENIDLLQTHVLSVNYAYHDSVSENILLTTGATLAVDSSYHATVSENTDLSGTAYLALNDSSHTHTSENINLLQEHSLLVSDTAHQTTSGNINLLEGAGLAVNDCFHEHVSTGVALGVFLAVADSLHVHTAQEAVLTGIHYLAIDSTYHAHIGQNVGTTTDLIVDDTYHEQTATGEIKITEILPGLLLRFLETWLETATHSTWFESTTDSNFLGKI